MVTGEGPRVSIRERVGRALDKLHADMRLGPLSMMRMEIEECYVKGIKIDQKEVLYAACRRQHIEGGHIAVKKRRVRAMPASSGGYYKCSIYGR